MAPYDRGGIGHHLVQVMAWCKFSTKPLPVPNDEYFVKWARINLFLVKTEICGKICIQKLFFFVLTA